MERRMPEDEIPPEDRPEERAPNPERSGKSILRERMGGVAIFYNYDAEGRIFSTTAVREKRMFSDEDIIAAGFATAS